MQMDDYEILTTGGKHYGDKLRETLELLIDDDCSSMFQTITGHSVFVLACATAPLPIVRSLATTMQVATLLNEWAPSAEEWYTPLMAAVVKDRADIVQYLVHLGADASSTNPFLRWTPLFYAVSGSPQIVLALVQSIENTHSREAAIRYVNHRDENGATAFDTAVAGEYFAAADILASYQPDFLAFTIPYSQGSTCLFNLCGLSSYKANQLFYILDMVDLSAGLPQVDNEGVTILHASCGVPIGSWSC
jgi:hypothetical protein